MTLSVIGAGFGRTGTLSLKTALEQLGHGPCHHMEELLGNPAQLPHWQAAAAGEPVDWDAVLAGYGSVVDWPGAHFWRELADAYPNAKVILTVRHAERWWESFARTIKPLIEMRDRISDPHVRGVLAMSDEIVRQQILGGTLDDRAGALVAFSAHIDEVCDALPSERLLLFDVADGWPPLCDFLAAPLPDAPFPRSNSVDEFWELPKNTDSRS